MYKGIRDRTGEFRATVDSYSTREPVVRRRSPAGDASNISKQHSEFMQRASLISLGIQTVCTQLERLTKATRSRTSLIDDHKQAEYIELSAAIEHGISKINQDISTLRVFQRDQPEQQHSGGVIVSLQSRLADATRNLSNVLRDRERIELEQRSRREQYSAGIKLPDNLSISSDRGRLLDDSDRSGQPSQMGNMGKPSSYQQLALVQSTDTSYLEARSAAVQGIEKSINEIGHIFQQLTHMIAEQGETVQRIDANIEDVGFNIERGHLELIKYYKYVSNNRWLLLKMFAVLIVFMVLFNAFLL
jgi:syntaxin 5